MKLKIVKIRDNSGAIMGFAFEEVGRPTVCESAIHALTDCTYTAEVDTLTLHRKFSVTLKGEDLDVEDIIRILFPEKDAFGIILHHDPELYSTEGEKCVFIRLTSFDKFNPAHCISSKKIVRWIPVYSEDGCTPGEINAYFKNK